MREFLMLLLFHKTLLLTPVPIDLVAEVDQRIAGTVVAINSGASFHVQIPELPPKAVERADFEQQLSRTYPPESIELVARSKSGQQFRFVNGTAISYSKDDVRLLLHSKEPFSSDVTFDSIVIRSKKNIQGVRIYWENGAV
jgi:hypothetical protein